MSTSTTMTVTATDDALDLIAALKQRYGAELLFHQSGGCCDGSAPMCFQQGDYIVGDGDVLKRFAFDLNRIGIHTLTFV